MKAFKLFEVAGIELEYMIVKADSLAVLPLCDELLRKASGGEGNPSELEFGELGWSNELVNHVVELKTLMPPSIKKLPQFGHAFQQEVNRANGLLAKMGARLMPGAMHPWMDPYTEMQLWPHEYSAVYEKYNELFDCRGHGWANLQSMHINLPFDGDAEFGQLHAAIRFLMPVMPALTASSPCADGSLTGMADFRLETYKNNSARMPEVTGKVIPEPVYTRAEYHEKIFDPLYRAIAPHDPEGIMQYEWLNSRGAIARFDRNAIEIRILDIQECPEADIQIALLLGDALRRLAAGQWKSLADLKKCPVDSLYEIYSTVVSKGDEALITDQNYLSALGCGASEMKASQVWAHLYRESGLHLPAVEHILKKGNLSSRIVASLQGGTSRENMHSTYSELCNCLRDGRQFG